MAAHFNPLIGVFNLISYAQACIKSISRVVDDVSNGVTDAGKLVADATGFTGWALETGERVNELNAHASTVFSNAPLNERIPAAVDVGWFATNTAANVVGTVQLGRFGIQAAGRARIQSITNSVNDAIGANPGIAQNALSPAEYAAGQNSIGVARMEYGNALERMTAERIQSSPIDSMFFEHVGGPSNPDFIGKGLLRGMNFDITTPGQIASHLLRPYGSGLNLIPYTRPSSFLVFP